MQKTSALTRTILFGTGLTSLFLGLNSSIVSAQVTPFTIQSTGTLSGTLELPAFNPNFNRAITEIDTDSNGTYFRHGKAVYSSDYVKMRTGNDGSLQYYVDFKGIPVISKNGVIASPVLSGGELQDYKYQGKIDGTKFQAVVQDEFGIKAGFYKGIVTDPKTGKQYEGTFKVTGQGPRYSDPNGGESPTVFDFKSDLPGKPTVTSLEMNNSPLVKLYVEVPADAIPITTTDGNSTPNEDYSIGTENQIIPPSPINTPNNPPSPITANNNINSFDSLLPSTIPDIEFSNGNPVKLNPKVESLSKEREVTIRKKLIGPRSRVLLR